MESRTLALGRSLSQQLQTTCLVLASSLQGLPTHIQQEALWLSQRGYLHSSTRLERIRGSLDDVMDYMVNNTPLNWLVGPFYPRLVAMETRTARPPSPPQVEMEPLRLQGDS